MTFMVTEAIYILSLVADVNKYLSQDIRKFTNLPIMLKSARLAGFNM